MARFVNFAIFAFVINVMSAIFAAPAIVPEGFQDVTQSLWQDTKWNTEVNDSYQTIEFRPAAEARDIERDFVQNINDVRKGISDIFSIVARTPIFIPNVIGQIFRLGGMDSDTVDDITTLFSLPLYFIYISGFVQFITGRSTKNIQ
jgi:hypothetical protein